ncbi:Exoribonuclease phosphorolytic domain 1 [Trinorchestia longiramus]|nr:Exoribonuclease phosphorolytic domain 1 [Trinorchestia longiramus]
MNTSQVSIGNTTVVCGVKAEMCRPSLENPTKGFIVPNVELYSCCSPNFKAGPPGEKAISTSQFLSNLLDNNEVVNYEDLCIVPNKWVWCLYCDVVCLDFDGNLVDASLLSVLAALLHLSLPLVSMNPDTGSLTLSAQHIQKLAIKNRPVSTTFGIYSSEIQLLDPSASDESECGGEVVVVLLENGDVCCTNKTGRRQVSGERIRQFITTAQRRLPVLQRTLQEALDQHAMNST